jgi:hypothetical protein
VVQLTKKKREKEFCKKKHQGDVWVFARHKGFQQQFVWCQLFPSVHFFYIWSFPFHLFFSCDQKLRLVFTCGLLFDFASLLFSALHIYFTAPNSTQSIVSCCTIVSGTITLPLQIAAPALDLSGRERTCSLSDEGVFHI